MRVRAHANRGAALRACAFEMGYFPQSEFHLTPGKNYIVAGINQYQGLVLFLVRDDAGLPCYVPGDLVHVVDNSIPEWWVFGTPDPGVDRLWGYPALTDESGYLALAELEPHALRLFDQEIRKAEAEQPDHDSAK